VRAAGDVRALVSAIAAAAPGTSLRVPPGRYALPATLVLARSIHLVAEGPATLSGGGGRGLVRLLGHGQVYAFTGITFEAGRAEAGGALSTPNRNVLVVDRCRFVRNRARTHGGAIALALGEARLTRCLLEGNRAGGGGAIAAGRSAKLELDACELRANEADLGGALFAFDSAAVRVERTRFAENLARRGRGGHALFALGAPTIGPSVRVTGTAFEERAAIACDAGKKCSIQLGGCALRADATAHAVVVDLGGNVRDPRSAAGRELAS